MKILSANYYVSADYEFITKHEIYIDNKKAVFLQ